MDPDKPESKSRPRAALSSGSLKSDNSKDWGVEFRERSPGDQSSFDMNPHKPESKSRPTPAPSSASMKSDNSKDWGVEFRERLPGDQSFDMNPHKPKSKSRPKPAPSSASMKSDNSKDWGVEFRERLPGDQSSFDMNPHKPESKSRPKPAPSSASMKSDNSKDWGVEFRERLPGDQREPELQVQLDTVFKRLEQEVLSFVKEELKRLHKLLASENPERSPENEEQSSREAVLSITVNILKKMKQEQLAERLRARSSAEVCKDKLKRRLQQKFSSVFEGVAKAGNSAPLKQIYTELHITEGETVEINQKHEVRQIESTSRKPFSSETRITCEDLFRGHFPKQQPKQAELTKKESLRAEITKRKRSLRTNLTKGIKSKRTDQTMEIIRAGLTEKQPIEAKLTEERTVKGEQPVEEDMRQEQPVEEDLRQEQPVQEDMRQEQPVQEDMRQEQPVEEELIEEQPGEEELIEESQVEEELIEEQEVQEELTEERPIRTVLTKGVAGVGKTVLTQKFSLDWAEGRANREIQVLFPFTFRELNVLSFRTFTLMELLHHCYSETKDLSSFEDLQALFIFDGLDECRIPLDFSRTRVLTEPSESASVEELLVNLIRGSLLPCARLWITTRPAAANQIPAECVSMVTEVQGFTDEQKDHYFMKRFKDEQQASAIIKHIKSIHSLYSMCRLPVFCWILSTVLDHVLRTFGREELPHTFTQMYIYFLVVQAKVKNIKYHGGSGADLPWNPETLEMVWSLAKLAFEQLMKGNLIFYEQDLRECGLDAAEIARYSGVFTEVFREEPGLYQNKIYCFIHLTIQEFMAALHAHQTFFSTGVNLLSPSHSDSPEAFYRSVIDLALKSPNGHMDMFLRFLLGFSLSVNQNLLTGLLTPVESKSSNKKTVEYIKLMLNEEAVSPESSLNLLHCLNELHDQSLLKQIQKTMRQRPSGIISPAQWSALSFNLLSSDSDLEEFDLRNYNPTETVLLKLLPVIKASTKAILSGCGLSPLSCAPLALVFSSSTLTELDLSNNDLQDLGVEWLCSGLNIGPCRLQTLRLSGCLVSDLGGASLASTLSSTPSKLRDLDLSYNHLGASAELLTALLAPRGPLDSLRLDPAGEQWMVPGLRKYSCQFSLDPNTAHKNLLLSEDKRTVIWLKEKQPYPDLEDRFMEHHQVLGSTGLRGRCYWEVQWRGRRGVEIAVSYRRIGQRAESRFGDNDRSWSLRIYNGFGCGVHNNRETDLFSTSFSGSGVVGVFLDTEAGALSFYEVYSGGRQFHLYTFSSAFTEPLFPGFGLVDEGDSVSVERSVESALWLTSVADLFYDINV